MLTIQATANTEHLQNSNLISVATQEAMKQVAQQLSLSVDLLPAKQKNFTLLRIQDSNRVCALMTTPSSIDEFGWKEIGGSISRSALSGNFVLDCRGVSETELEALLSGLTSGGYSFTRFKSKEQPQADFKLELLVSENDIDATVVAITKSLVIDEALSIARDLANTPGNHLNPEVFAKIAAEQLSTSNIEVSVWDVDRLKTERCGALLAVGQGSVIPPRLVKARYGNGPVKLSLVGKGITFDSGGLSLKPADSMLGMKYDMTGAAVALGALLAIAKLNLQVCVEAVLCLAENMPGPSATRPGDVVTSRSGITIEVTNTDAEGRLVLADGIDVALESKPEYLVDIATLTGAATIALGTRYGGLMGTGTLPDLFLMSASQAHERFWRMPLAEDSRKVLESSVADIMNAKVGSRAGGMLVGAQFLADFVNKEEVRNWAHLDIANVASNDGAPYEENPSGPTAYGLRSIVRLAENLVAAE